MIESDKLSIFIC